jgi:hypothetical protein
MRSYNKRAKQAIKKPQVRPAKTGRASGKGRFRDRHTHNSIVYGANKRAASDRTNRWQNRDAPSPQATDEVRNTAGHVRRSNEGQVDMSQECRSIGIHSETKSGNGSSALIWFNSLSVCVSEQRDGARDLCVRGVFDFDSPNKVALLNSVGSLLNLLGSSTRLVQMDCQRSQRDLQMPKSVRLKVKSRTKPKR